MTFAYLTNRNSPFRAFDRPGDACDACRERLFFCKYRDDACGHHAQDATTMTTFGWICLIVVFFFTAVISVVTGGTSLITVPVMLQFGIDPHVAVATNMFALIFLSLGGTLPFLGGQVILWHRLPALTGLTLVGSILGAFFLLAIPTNAMLVIIAVAMIVVAVFSLVKHDAGVSDAAVPPSRTRETIGYLTAVLLGVYGGFFSGGYVALLTAAYVAFFDMTFLEAVAVTKVLNVFSSLVATAIFAGQGIIDWNLGLLIGCVSFVGAILGAAVASKMSNIWLRRVFLTAAVLLAFKTVFFDMGWRTD